VDRAAGQVPVIQEFLTNSSNLPIAPDQRPSPDLDVLDEAQVSPQIGGAGEKPGINFQRIQKNVTGCHVKFLNSLTSIGQNRTGGAD
jgi:hypothetical protein